MSSHLQFFSVAPLSSFGRPTVRGDTQKLAIIFPQALAAHCRLLVDQRVHIALGRERLRPVAIRISPAADGGYAIRRNGKSIQLRAPELACKAPVCGPASYRLMPDGAVIIDLPQPWDLVDDRAVSIQPRGPSPSP